MNATCRRLAIAPLVWVLLLPGVALAWHDGRPHESRPHDGRPRDNRAHPPVVAHPSGVVHPRVLQAPVLLPFFRFGAPVVQSPPPVIYVQPAPVVYVISPVDYAPEPDLTPPPAPVEPATEIVLPTGRWELHGDGVTTSSGANVVSARYTLLSRTEANPSWRRTPKSMLAGGNQREQLVEPRVPAEGKP